MKSNEQLQKEVMEAIKWEPLLNAAEIGVTAKDGVVTLSGIVNNYSKKAEAEHAAKNVSGVNAVVEKIEIKFDSNDKKNDNILADEIVHSLKSKWDIPDNKIKVKVENGWITLDGELHWNYQKQTAIRSINSISGITGITNNIQIKSEIHDGIEKKDIELALLRNWAIDDSDIKVSVEDNIVNLSGKVDSWYQKDEAGRIAWNAPGVSKVKNEIIVDFDF
jgi:osmotically-inducible protein OsmY